VPLTCFWIGTKRSRSWLKGAGYSDSDPFPAPAPAWLWLAAESATPTRQLFLHGWIARRRRRCRPDAGGCVDCNFATDVTTPRENKTCCFPAGSAAVSLRRAASRRFYCFCLAGHATRAPERARTLQSQLLHLCVSVSKTSGKVAAVDFSVFATGTQPNMARDRKWWAYVLPPIRTLGFFSCCPSRMEVS